MVVARVESTLHWNISSREHESRHQQVGESIIHESSTLLFSMHFKYETDMKLFGVSSEEVQDLITKVPGNNVLGQHLLQGDFKFFFCRQSMQGRKTQRYTEM